MNKEGKNNHPEKTPKPLETIDDLATKMRESLYMKDLLEGANHQMLKENEELQKRTQLERRKNEELQIALAEMQVKAEHDPLTGLLNRASFTEVAKQLTESRVNSVLIALDIDEFKSINDEFGHDVGDEALKTTAKFLQKQFRPTDFIFRWGGEEIVVLLPNSSVRDIVNLLHRVNGGQKLEVPFDYKSESRPDNLITFSGGILALQAGENIESAMSRVDKALYEAKQSGRNQILVVAEPIYDTQVVKPDEPIDLLK